jgi:hypothetical protein
VNFRAVNFRPCPREAEVKALLQSGHWPQACPTELRTHAATCTACANQVLLTQAFRGARDASASAAQLPPPGVLWWRAQLRRRNAAVERIGKPIFGAQVFAIAITLVIAAGVVLSQARYGLRWLAELPQSPIFNLSSLWHSATASNVDSLTWFKLDGSIPYLIPALALLGLLGGVVLYLATEKSEQ